jgi:hypothetical protein
MDDTTAPQYLDSLVCLLRGVGLRYLLSNIKNVTAKRVRKSILITAVPEVIDPVFAETSQNARFLLSENERFGLVF